jgi:AraC-like DNA-binding protein
MVCWDVVVTQFAPGAALAPFVRVFEIVETGDDEAVTRTLFPDVGITVGFRYAGCATLITGAARQVVPGAAAVGLRTAVRRMHTAPNGGIVLAKFRAAGAASFFTTSLHHLFGEMPALDDLLDRDAVARTSRQIIAATSDAERVAIVEQFLLAQQQQQQRHQQQQQQQQRAFSPDPLVGGALRAICAAAGAIRVGQIARDLRVSQDTLEKRFRRIVGASPKQFASIVRLRRAVELSRENTTLTALAQDAGYYDQSHFIRDFRAFTGDAPSHFFLNATYC